LSAPCKDCPDRYVGCHSKCEKYIAFNKERQEFLEKRSKANALEYEFWHTSRYRKYKPRRK
jgi:hypothetical protein